MRLRIDSRSLVDAVRTVCRVIDARSPMCDRPVIGLRAERDVLELGATGAGVGIALELPASVEVAGACRIEAARLAAWATPLGTDEPVGVALEGERCVFDRAGVTTRLATVSSEPDVPNGSTVAPAEQVIAVGGRELASILEDVSHAVCEDEVRERLNGVCFHATATSSGRMLRGVASDGQRLAYREVAACDGGTTSFEEAIVPRFVLPTLTALAKRTPAPVLLCRSGGTLEFRSIAWRLRVDLIGDTFPRYEEVLPRGAMHRFTTSPAVLRDAVRRLLQGHTDRERRIAAAFTASGVRLWREEDGVVSAEASVGGVLEGQPFELGVNGRHLVDILARLRVADVTIAASGPARPMSFSCGEDRSRCFVLMALRGGG